MNEEQESEPQRNSHEIMAEVAELRGMLEHIGKPLRFEFENFETSTQETNASNSEFRQIEHIKAKLSESVYQAMMKKNLEIQQQRDDYLDSF